MGRNERRCHEGTLFVAVALARRGERGSRSGARRCGAGDDEVSAPPPKMSGVACTALSARERGADAPDGNAGCGASVNNLGKASCSLPPRAKGARRPPWAVHRTAHHRAAFDSVLAWDRSRPVPFPARWLGAMADLGPSMTEIFVL